MTTRLRWQCAEKPVLRSMLAGLISYLVAVRAYNIVAHPLAVCGQAEDNLELHILPGVLEDVFTVVLKLKLPILH